MVDLDKVLNPPVMIRPRMAKPKACHECIYKYTRDSLACKSCPRGRKK
jgi:hypothetical protein